MVFDVSKIDAAEIQSELDEAKNIASRTNLLGAGGVAEMFRGAGAAQNALGLLGDHRDYGDIAAEVARSAGAYREVEQNTLARLAAGGSGYGGIAAEMFRAAVARPSDCGAFGDLGNHSLKDALSQSWGGLGPKGTADMFGAANQLTAAAVSNKAWQSALTAYEPPGNPWKPILMRWSNSWDGILSESWSTFQKQLPFGARPIAISVLEDLRAAGVFQSAAAPVRIMEVYKTYSGGVQSFGGACLEDRLSWPGVATPMPRPWYPPPAHDRDARPERLEVQPSPGATQTPDVQSLAELDTGVRSQPLITREKVVRVANHPWTITIGGTVIGETIFLIVTHYVSP